MEQSIGFIGGGRATRILLQAFKNKNAMFSTVIVNDKDSSVTARLRESFPEVQEGHVSVAACQDIVVISLHPPEVPGVLDRISDNLNNSSIVISLAPKITIAGISSRLARVKNIIRLIPNATSYINEGYNPVCFSPDFFQEEKQNMLDLLGLMGKTFEVKENKLESYAIMSAMLPTYFWFQWKELAEIGQKTGLTEDESNDTINETLISALNMMFRSGLTADEVMDLIPVKPIGAHETEIKEIYRTKLIGLFDKIKP